MSCTLTLEGRGRPLDVVPLEVGRVAWQGHARRDALQAGNERKEVGVHEVIGEEEPPKHPVVGERRIRAGPDDLIQRGHHGDGLVGEIPELLLERAERVPVVLV